MTESTTIPVVTTLPEPKPSFPWKKIMAAVVIGAVGASAVAVAVTSQKDDEFVPEKDEYTVDPMATI